MDVEGDPDDIILADDKSVWSRNSRSRFQVDGFFNVDDGVNKPIAGESTP